MAFKSALNNNMTLIKIAAVTGFATVAMGTAFKVKIQSNIKETEFFKDVLKTVRSHRGAVHYLGEPIKDYRIDIGDTSKNYATDNEARYEVPVKGPKQKGKIYFWAEKEVASERWTVKRIELGLDSEPDRRLIIKSTNNE